MGKETAVVDTAASRDASDTKSRTSTALDTLRQLNATGDAFVWHFMISVVFTGTPPPLTRLSPRAPAAAVAIQAAP